MSFAMFRHFASVQKSFAALSAWSETAVSVAGRDGILRLVPAAYVTGNAFDVLRIQPFLGRMLGAADDVPGGRDGAWPVVVSHSFWAADMGGDPNVIGRQIKLRMGIGIVVGVTPPAFTGIRPGNQSYVYIPFSYVGVDRLEDPKTFFMCNPIGRLKPGLQIFAASAEIATMQPALLERFLPPEAWHDMLIERGAFRILPARTGLPFLNDGYLYSITWMQALVAVVLFLCCLNVGSLMLSKMYARSYEFAVRSALGAARARLISQYFAESLLIALVGGTIAAILAWFGSGFLSGFFLDPYALEAVTVRPDGAVFLISGSLALLSTLVFGTLPAWRAGNEDPGILLKSRNAPGRNRLRVGKILVPLQIAVSLILIVTAALLSRTLISLRSEHTGSQVDGLTMTTPLFQGNDARRGDALLNLYQAMVDRMERHPGISSAAVTWYTPLTNDQATAGFEALSSDMPVPPKDLHMAYNQVGPGCAFFAVLALLLSALGLYGLIASHVAQRTSDIGIRIALGADRSEIIKLFLVEACQLLVTGILLAAPLLFIVLRALQGMLYGVSAFDALTLAATIAVLAAVALGAAYIPARRAASNGPLTALRME
jgi:macrolide transport system ATP-binding/permease protein